MNNNKIVIFAGPSVTKVVRGKTMENAIERDFGGGQKPLR